MCTFWKAAAEHLILFFVGAALARCVRVAVINRCPLAAVDRPLDPLAICKLGAVVDGDRLKDHREKLSVFSLEVVEGPDDALGGAVWDADHDLLACPPLSQHKEPGLCRLPPDHRVHFPVSECLSGINLRGAALDTLSLWCPGCFLDFVVFLFSPALDWEVFICEGEEKPHVDILVKRPLGDRDGEFQLR